MRVLLMAAVLAAAPMAALAAEPAPPQPGAAPAPETLALARQLVEATGATRDFGARLRDFLSKMCAQTTCPPAVKARIEALTGV